MTKTQRARLLALQAIAAADLSAAAAQELATLTQLAAANPDATKDTDAPAAAITAPAGAKPGMIKGAAAVIAAAGTMLRNRASVATDLATANQTIVTITGERDAARGTVAAQATQIEAFATFLGFKPAELSGKDAPALNALFEEKLSALLVDHAATIGMATGKVPKKIEGNGAAETADLYAEYLALAAKDSVAAAAYWQANIEPAIRAAQKAAGY